MIRQSLAFDDILEKKFKILRTSIVLGNLKNREETFRDYEDTARDIDKIKKSVYEELLASKMYTTVTLEDEQSRLKDLIAFIQKRVEERNDFVDDYIKITSNFLDGLDRVSLEDELDNYRYRYNNISEYLNNCKEIKELNLNLKKLRDELEEKYENKANNELINAKLEEELIDEFNKFISRDNYYSKLNYTDIDLELSKLDSLILDKKSVLDTFMTSYQALINAGISGTEREEYSSYVQDARMSYYDDVEKKCILNIYKLVLDKQVDYDRLYEKRASIDTILIERIGYRKILEINNRDELEYFANLCKEQFSIIKSQKFNIENIDKLILEISDCENKLASLESANNRVDIVDILNEYSVNKLEDEKIDLLDENQIFEEVIETVENNNVVENNIISNFEDGLVSNIKEEVIDNVDNNNVKIVEKVKTEDVQVEKDLFNNVDNDSINNVEENIIVVEKKPANMVVKIKDPIKINVKTASDTAKLVMKKVVIILEPKKFGDQRDKLKEAEMELEREKRELAEKRALEKIQNDLDKKMVQEDIVFEQDICNDIEVEKVFEDDFALKEEINDENNSFVETNSDLVDNDSIVNTFSNGNDIFLDDDMFEINLTSGIGVELDTKEVFGDSSIKETKELTEIKINASDIGNMSIPTEIFIEDPPAKKEEDLFKITDPFLDDNEFELENDNVGSDEIRASMPIIKNIGSVKPNNALSKIENVVKDNTDVILPNLGLVDSVKSDVPIVSENYIN